MAVVAAAMAAAVGTVVEDGVVVAMTGCRIWEVAFGL